MIEQSPLPNLVSELRDPTPDDFDESIFETIGDNLAERMIIDIGGCPPELANGTGSPTGSRQVSLRDSVKETLGHLVGQLGEVWIGGPPNPAPDLEPQTIGRLEKIAESWQGFLHRKLVNWSDELDKLQPPVPRSQFFLYLWWESSRLWEGTIAYRAIRVLSAATARFAEPAVPQPADEPTADGEPAPDGEPARSWENLAWPAVCRAVALAEADSWTFKQINLSSAAGLVDEANRAADKSKAVGQEIRTVLAALDGDPEPDDVRLTWRGLWFLAAVARDAKIFYTTMASLATTVTEFERWMTSAHRPEVEPERPARPARPLVRDDELLGSVNASLGLLYRAQDQLLGPDLAECEPWAQLLAEMRQMITSAEEVLVPQRVWLRYCFPFAVEEAEGGGWVKLLKPTDQAKGGNSQKTLREQLEEEFGRALGRDAVGRYWITVHEPEDLAQTQFFKVSDTDDDLFGGIRMELSELDFTGDWWPGTSGEAVGYRCRVWLDLNQMGVLCLCVEPTEPMRFPRPHVLFRALRAGSPFPVGDTVALASRPSSGPSHAAPAWDTLDAFARDIIRYVANILYVAEKRAREPHDSSPAAQYLPGNSHLVAIVQTDGQFKDQSGDITQTLDGAIGGRVLLRPIQRPVSTLEEWIRLPPRLRGERRAHDAVNGVLPEIGYAGDWFVHTGDMSIFGIVATPPWIREVYPETAQFANSWSPLLRLWNRRLQQAIRDLEPRKSATDSAEELRQIERRVRRRLAQINSEDLCPTLTNRRFLDEILDAAGVGRLQDEIETHLESAEQLTDWYNATDQQRSATRRDVWLFIIALLGIFSLGDFMLLANSTNLHGKFLFINLTANGTWEDWLILTAFFAALTIGLLFGLGWYKLPRKQLKYIHGKMKRGKLAATRQKSRARRARQS